MSTLLARIVLVLAVLALVPAAALADSPEFEPTTENLFTYNPNAGCAERGGHLLVPEPTVGSNCGYIYGLPIGEVDRQSGLGLFDNARVYTSEAAEEGLYLDASRAVEGKVRVAARESFCLSVVDSTVNGTVGDEVIPCVAHGGTGGGVGEITVDLIFSGKPITGSAFAPAVQLGTTQVTATILPGDTHVDLEYAIDLPANRDQTLFESFTMSVDTHGTHLGTGYANASGETTVNIPTLTPVDAS